MQQQNIISSSCRATPTKYTHNSFSHLLQHTLSFKLNIKLIFLISLIFLSVLVNPVSLSIPDLKSFAYYAAAAYKSLTNWNCGEVCQATQGTKLVKEFGVTSLNTKGFIALDELEKLIIVSFRGTEPGSIRNYITDGLAFKTNYFPVRGANVHFGFYNAFLAMRSQITGDVIKLHQEHPDFRLGFMGHSLGGAIATFSALEVIQQVPELANNENLFLATLGQPRVGDAAFAKHVDSNIKAIRTIVRGDPIPRLPPSWPIPGIGNYRHFGEELYIDKPDEDPDNFRVCSAEDPSCSESVPLRQLTFKAHSGPYYGVNMREPKSQDDDEYENYDFSADPYFAYDPNFDYSAMGVNGTKGVNGVDGAKGVNGVDGAKGVNGSKEINGVDSAKGVNGTK